MKSRLVVFALLSLSLAAQRTAPVCNTLEYTDCRNIDTSSIGGIRFEDYKVTNPKAIYFNSSLRRTELNALGSTFARQLCVANPIAADLANPPSITFSNVQSFIAESNYTNGGRAISEELIYATLENVRTNDGWTSPTFGYSFTRTRGQSTLRFAVVRGNGGLENIPGLTQSAFITYDTNTRSIIGTSGPFPASNTLRRAILALALNLPQVLNTGTFTETPPSSGQRLWNISDIRAAAALFVAALRDSGAPTVPVAPKSGCVYTSGYPICSGDSETEGFKNLAMLWGADYLSGQSPNAASVLLSNFTTWANAKAPIIDPQTRTSDYTYATMDLIKPIVGVWPQLREDPLTTPAQRTLIDNWIDTRLVPAITWVGGEPPNTRPQPNNWAYFSRSISMANAIRRQDHLEFARGIEIFFVALNQMRRDGSFPLEASRGVCSATYQNVDIQHLVSIAEMAASQGYDLYSLSVDGKKLATAIQFLLDARDNPSLLQRYSIEGALCPVGKPSDPVDFNAVFGTFSGSTSHPLAWAEAFIARFPNSPLTTRLRRNFPTPNSNPRPTIHAYSGGNTSCFYYKPYELTPLANPSLQIVSGDNQSGLINTELPQALSVRLLSGAISAPGVLVNFAITSGSAVLTQAQALTDATGNASTKIKIGSNGGPILVTATALGLSSSFKLTSIAPSTLAAIAAGGITGVGGSVPAVTTISQGSLFTIYGVNFTPPGTGQRVNTEEIAFGNLPQTLLGVCVSVNGIRAPILDVFPNQINAVMPAILTNPSLVRVITNCGGAGHTLSEPQSVTVAAASPEFLYFQPTADGRNAVAAIDAQSGLYLGPRSILGGILTPAKPGDYVTIFASGLGATNPTLPVGTIPTSIARVRGKVELQLGSATLTGAQILYAGLSPGLLIYQVNFQIPSDTPAGSLPIRILIDGLASPSGPYLHIQP